MGADWSFAGAEEDLPDMNELRAKAEAGKAWAQTQLADLYLAASDFTNAVLWYRKAAGQSHVPAQLSLAACLIAGRGTQKNPGEAAKLLRRAADSIEAGVSTSASAPTVMPTLPDAATNTQAIWITRETEVRRDAAQLATTPVHSKNETSASPAGRTNLTRVARVDALLPVEPVLQDVPAVVRPPSDSR
jgi:hypothetical protein